MRGALLIVSLFAVLFAIIRWSHLSPFIPLFYAMFAVLISLAQMVFEKRPRLATIGSGAFYLPVCYLLEPAIQAHFSFSRLGSHVAMLVVAGGFLAYLGGTLLAGVFLVWDFTSQVASRPRGSDRFLSPSNGRAS
jgi:hypothetical protein